MGNYIHFASSMHVYGKHYIMVKNILSAEAKNTRIIMPRMGDLKEIRRLQINEERVRKGKKNLLKLEDKFCLWCQEILMDKKYERYNH